MGKLVSILVPAYNAQKWIDETIQSALAQTWPQKEIIIVDDGSTDNTLKICRQYESSILKVIHQKKSGACCARNHAFKECQGEYIQWLDADDLLAFDKIERQMNIAQILDDSYVLFSAAWGKFYYRRQKAKFQPTPLWHDLDASDWLVLRMENPWMMHPSTWLVSRDLTHKAGPWDERLLRDQDGEYFSRVVSLCRIVKFVSESRCYYRMANPTSVSNSTSRKTCESIAFSLELAIGHILSRENSKRTRQACIWRLNMEASMLEPKAPEIAQELRKRITDLGGVTIPYKNSRRYNFIKAIFGETKAQIIKNSLWKLQQRIYCSYDYCLAKLQKKLIN
jgi:glycosyltransferase involved in cell wall biosynthesis